MGSVTELIGRLRTGSPIAFGHIFDRFFSDHVARLKRRLGAAYAGIEDPEDVALCVFHRLWEEVVDESPLTAGLSDRGGLLRVLCVLTEQKLREVHRYEHRLCRDSRQTRREADQSSPDESCSLVQAAVAAKPCGEWDAAFLDFLAHLLALLSESHQAIVLRKLDGLSLREIAAEMCCSERTVVRQLSEIRDRWRVQPDLAAALQSLSASGNALPV